MKVFFSIGIHKTDLFNVNGINATTHIKSSQKVTTQIVSNNKFKFKFKLSFIVIKFKLSFIVIPLHVWTYSGTRCRASQDHGAT